MLVLNKRYLLWPLEKDHKYRAKYIHSAWIFHLMSWEEVVLLQTMWWIPQSLRPPKSIGKAANLATPFLMWVLEAYMHKYIYISIYIYIMWKTHKPSSHLYSWKQQKIRKRWGKLQFFCLSLTFNSRKWWPWLRSSKLGVPLSYEERGCEIPDCSERAVTLETWYRFRLVIHWKRCLVKRPFKVVKATHIYIYMLAPPKTHISIC